MSSPAPAAEIRERLEEEAVAWLARLTSGAATEPERARFRDWYAHSPAHARAFDLVAGLWQGLDAVLVPRPVRARPRAWPWVR
ncbi:MAG: FecR/PupR family sigma factor regulator, partial [Terriglobales bacterium]